jgi:hypothetical protein
LGLYTFCSQNSTNLPLFFFRRTESSDKTDSNSYLALSSGSMIGIIAAGFFSGDFYSSTGFLGLSIFVTSGFGCSAGFGFSGDFFLAEASLDCDADASSSFSKSSP